MKAADVILHRPTGEKWVVACARPETGELICAGWPESLAQMSDCEIVHESGDEEHRDMLRRCAKLGGLRGSWARHQLAELGES